MSFHREFSKILTKKSSELATKQPWYKQVKPRSPLQEIWDETVVPLYWKYWKVPHEKFAHRMTVNHLRGYGLMFDDTLNEKEPLMERAMEILPYDIRVQRYRRLVSCSRSTPGSAGCTLTEQAGSVRQVERRPSSRGNYHGNVLMINGDI
jgi:hypothetical protein